MVGGSSGASQALVGYADVDAASTGSAIGVYGFATASHPSGTVANIIASSSNSQMTGAGTLTKAHGGTFSFGLTGSATGTVTEAIGVNVHIYDLSSGNGTIQKAIGLKILDINVGALENYAIYTGLGAVRFGDGIFAERTGTAGGTVTAYGTITSKANGAEWDSGFKLIRLDGTITPPPPPPPEPEPDPIPVEKNIVLYAGGPPEYPNATLQDFDDEFTLLSIRNQKANLGPPPQSGREYPVLYSQETTLALTLADSAGNEEYLDIFNQRYFVEQNYGIRIQKRGAGVYREFLFEFWDGTRDASGVPITDRVYRIDPTTFATTYSKLLITAASASGGAGFRLPQGSEPNSPANGDVWTTNSNELRVRLGGTTYKVQLTAV